MKFQFKKLLIALSLIWGHLLFSPVYGAPGEIRDRPLFLGFSVQPNIYFMMDDSGSMAWDVTKKTDAINLYPPKNKYYTYIACGYCNRTRGDGSCSQWRSRSCGSYRSEVTIRRTEYSGDGQYINPTLRPLEDIISPTPYSKSSFRSDNRGNLDSNGLTEEMKLSLCPGYNATAFDISQKYTPWVNKPESTINISGHYYAIWNDSKTTGTPGVLDPGECSEPLAVSRLSSDDQKKYRNWYSYYRTRQNVAKKAVSEVVDQSEARMGLGTINRGQYFSVDDMKEASNKSALLSKVFSVVASGGTPLRSALDSAGKYYQGSSSPIQSEDEGGSCQQNYTILMTDGYWNSDSNWSGPGNFDGTSSNEHVRASDRDSYSDTLADVALKYYATDLKTSLANEVPTIDGVDENDAQHMVTFTVAFGVNGEVVPDSKVSGQETDSEGMPLHSDQPFDWPKPESNKNSTIDDVRHAAWNGRGLYLNAGNPESLINALSKSIDEIESRTGTASALAFNSTSYRTDSKFYYAQFSSGSWAGNLKAQELSSDLTKGNVIWEAKTELDKLNPNNRNILTFDSATGRGTAFRTGSLPTTHEDDLKILYSSYSNHFSSEAAFISEAVDYLRGDRSNEGSSAGQFRARSTALGDIVNSTPIFIAGPASNWPAFVEPGYITYMRSIAARTPMIYVGANDGMLHAFNAENGQEEFAYIPKGVTSTQSDRGLHYLLDQSYNHRYYVDGTVEVADAYLNGSWKTILIGGLGAGGKSLFALDVTDPTGISESNASSKVLWEIELADLGLTYPQAQVTKLNDGTWVAVVANGYHNTLDGKAKIFLIDLATGTLRKTFDTGYGSLSAGKCLDACNGMSKVTIRDLDGNGTADFIYAGDLKGNVWVINVNSSTPSYWVFDSQVKYLDGIAQSYSGSSIKPLFTAEEQRPITTNLVVVDNPTTYNLKTWPNQLVFFGTGQFIADGDHNLTDTENVYTVMHANSKYEMSVSGNSNLFVKRIIEDIDINPDPDEEFFLRKVRAKNEDEETFDYGYEVTPAGVQQKMGWYMPLPRGGERVVNDPISVSEFVVFNTLVPESDPCKFGASGFTMAVSLLYGMGPEPAILDFNRDGEINEQDDEFSGYQLDSPPAGLTKLGSKGIGQSTFDDPEFEALNLYSNHPNRISWEDLK